jgi:hypothetical protein
MPAAIQAASGKAEEEPIPVSTTKPVVGWAPPKIYETPPGGQHSLFRGGVADLAHHRFTRHP